jgi:hypothetical protein
MSAYDPKRTLIVGSGGLPYSLRQYTIPRYNERDFASALYRRSNRIGQRM